MKTPAVIRTPDALRRFWSARLPRERRILAAGAVLLILLALWLLLVEPAAEARARWQKTLPDLRSQLAQMQAISSEVANLPAPAASNAAGANAGELSRASVERSLKDLGLTAQTLSVNDGSVAASFTDVSFAALAEWLRQTQLSAQVLVTEATVKARDLPGRVDARFALQRAQ